MEHYSQGEMVEGSICGCCYDGSLVSAKKSKSTPKSQIKLNNCYCMPSIKNNCSVVTNSSKWFLTFNHSFFTQELVFFLGWWIRACTKHSHLLSPLHILLPLLKTNMFSGVACKRFLSSLLLLLPYPGTALVCFLQIMYLNVLKQQSCRPAKLMLCNNLAGSIFTSSIWRILNIIELFS